MQAPRRHPLLFAALWCFALGVLALLVAGVLLLPAVHLHGFRPEDAAMTAVWSALGVTNLLMLFALAAPVLARADRRREPDRYPASDLETLVPIFAFGFLACELLAALLL